MFERFFAFLSLSRCVSIFFVYIDSEIADQQLEQLEQIAALPMSIAESKAIKPIIETMDALLKDWIMADKDVKVDTYALKKMLVFIAFIFIVLLWPMTFATQSAHMCE